MADHQPVHVADVIQAPLVVHLVILDLQGKDANVQKVNDFNLAGGRLRFVQRLNLKIKHLHP